MQADGGLLKAAWLHSQSLAAFADISEVGGQAFVTDRPREMSITARSRHCVLTLAYKLGVANL